MIYALQGLRVLLCILVFLFHMNSASGSNFILFEGFGTLAVSYFFILSGFVHMYSYKEESTFDENKNKTIKRIISNYPLHWICLIPMIILRRKSLSFSLDSLFRVFINASLIQAWIPNKEVCLDFNGASWFLADIVFMIFMTIPLCKLANKIKSRKGIIFAFIGIQLIEILLSCIFNGKDPEHVLYFNPMIRLLDYFAGIITAKFVKNYGREFRTKHILETVCFLIIFFMTALYSFIPESFAHAGTIYLFTGCFTIFCFSTQNGWISKILTINLFKKLSKGTMYFYMVHQVVNFYFVGFLLHFKKAVNYGMHYTVVGGGSIVAAYVLYKLFSIINNKKSKKIIQRIN